VAGIVTAIRNNGQGVEGVMTDSNVCLIVARVFGSTANSQARLSDVLSGVKWVADQGANVINLSLGGPDYSVTAKKIYDNIRSKGVLVVAASGNGGNALNSYPASFDSVMSVGAVDVNLKKASFSQYNSNVDLAAPGVGILSIVPVGTGDVIKLSVGADAFVVNLLSYSVIPDTTGVSGELVDCGFGKSTCPGSSTGGNHICLIER
jgi:serine protease